MAAPVAQEVALFQNAPGLPTIYQLQQRQQQLQLHQQQQQQQLAAITDQLNSIHSSINRIPMQLYNATASSGCPLLYPPGIVPDLPLPPTKREIWELSAARCNASMVHLGLPPLAAEVSITQRRQVLMDYLGCAMRAWPHEDDSF